MPHDDTSNKPESDLELDDAYCPTCGACGESGCCPPTRCHYLDAYRGDYKELVKDWDFMWNLLEHLAKFYPDTLANILAHYSEEGQQHWEKISGYSYSILFGPDPAP